MFAAEEATEVAHLVADHDPETPRTAALIPQDEAAAVAGVQALVGRLHSLPRSIRSALKRAADSAGYLSDDRLQGLAELIQNADDLGATEAFLLVDVEGAQLLFAHNGEELTLHDVWALAIPWLSLKVADEHKLGRFGIGLKTLHSFSEILDVHQGHFHLRFSPDKIAPLTARPSWSQSRNGATTFAVPFAAGSLSTPDVAAWVTQWGEAGLVFLRSLSTITLVDSNGEVVERLHLDYGQEEPLELTHGSVVRRHVRAGDGRGWMIYNRLVPSPGGQERAGKAKSEMTPIAYAFPLFDGDVGHIHVGLPVRPIGLPFRMLAQFDPQPTRRDIADTAWNQALIAPLGQLWQDAARDIFGMAPDRAWAIVPLSTELDSDGRTVGRLRSALDQHFLHDARIALAGNLTFSDEGAERHLDELAYESAALTGILTSADVRLVADKPSSLPVAVRSADDRWRRVFGEFVALGAAAPALVDVADAVVLLDDPKRPPEFVADLVAATVEGGQSEVLESRTCLVLGDESRVRPDSRDDLNVLLPAEPAPLWQLLNIGSRLHPAMTGHPAWDAIRDWLVAEGRLRTSATDADALAVLAEAGAEGIELPEPLSLHQVDAIRRALQSVTEADRQRLGVGIGQAVSVDAISFDAKGTRLRIRARPCDAYFIERDANTWWIAAARTPNLVWIDRRYAEQLKTDGTRDSVGAQRLFRLLGAEVAPRIESHPQNDKRFVYHDPGVYKWVKGSPERRKRLLEEHQATYTVQDWIAPDLDAVLVHIAKERDAGMRQRRATAVLATLTRAWERLDGYASVRAAAENRGWVDKGRIEAWWLSSAASISWLNSEKGKPAAPDELRIKTPATIALYSDEPERFLSPALDGESYREVLARIGVAGDPTTGELLAKLGEVRDETGADPQRAEDLAAPLYQALAAQVRGQRLGAMAASAARSAFNRGHGLIATRAGWRRPSVVLAGPPIFEGFYDFVPSVSGTDRLWSLLSIAHPNHAHARGVLGELARRKTLNTAEKLVMLEALRLLATAPDDQLRSLRRRSVWVGSGWERKRPVYATSSPLIARALSSHVPVWEPGGALIQLERLIQPYGLTRLDAVNGSVIDATEAVEDEQSSQVLTRAVANLRADLARSDPQAEESLARSWDELASLSVAQLPGLRVRLHEPSHGLDETVELDAWLDIEAGVLYVRDEHAAGSPSSGGYAIAALFGGDTRRISHDWVAAWSTAIEGHREEAVTTAARLDTERKKERDDASEERLKALREQGKAQRGKNNVAGVGAPGSSGDPKPKGRSTHASVLPPRELVDPDDFNLRNDEGEIIGSASEGDTSTPKKSANRKPGKPKDPDSAKPKQPGKTPSRGLKNYTEEERETVGLQLVRRVLGGSEKDIVDIRHQRGVGADAIDELGNFFELKVYAGAIPESISLTSAEFTRAQKTEQFFLVVVGNVERGVKDPEVRIINDPLHHLDVLPSGSVSLGGVKTAAALRYTFEKQSDDT